MAHPAHAARPTAHDATITSGKWGLGHGQSGVQPGPNDALFFYNAGITSVAGAEQPTVTQGALGNADLRPERSAEQ